MNVKVFVNGKEVREEDLVNYEIKNERVKQIIAQAIGIRKPVRKEEI